MNAGAHEFRAGDQGNRVAPPHVMSRLIRRLMVMACLPVLAAGFVATSHGAQAESAAAQYPARPVRFIVPFPPGGGTDIVGRVIAQKLSERLHAQFVIDNRPGVASVLGSAIAAKAAPDGHTLLLVTASFAIAAGYYKEVPYDSIRDFDAIGQVATAPLVFVVHPSVPVHSIRELIALAKAQPDKLNYASGGEGGINHLPAEMFKSMTGARMTHIPYKGAGPALTALIAGEVQVMIATVGSCLPQIRSGKLRALALGGARRSALLADLPTVAEAGWPDYAADNWYAMVAPRGTPRAILQLLNREIVSLMGGDDIRVRFATLGFEPAPSTPEAFARYLPIELVKWRKAIHVAGIGS